MICPHSLPTDSMLENLYRDNNLIYDSQPALGSNYLIYDSNTI